MNPKKRVREQGYSVFQVLEVHEDIKVASEREIELQIEYGYGRDTSVPYSKSATFGTYEGRSKAGKKNITTGHISNLGKINGPIQGKKNVKSGHLASISTFESRGKGGKLVGKIWGPINGKKAVESGQLASIRTLEGSIQGGKTAIKKVNSIERTCPYCSKTMNCGTYGRWHGQKCKLVPVNT